VNASHTNCHVALLVTEIGLWAWLAQAKPCDRLTYHRGFLALDTVPMTGRLLESERAELIRVAGRTWWASEHKLGHLVQVRCGSCDYEYLIIATPHNDAASHRALRRLVEEVDDERS
jgi:hypothetical protein